MITAGTIRAAPALALVQVMGELGCDPKPILVATGWTEAMLEHPDRPIPFAALGRLIAAAAQATACPHLGLLVGQRTGPSMMGAVGFAARNAPDVRAALQLAARHLGAHDRGGVVQLAVQADIVTFGYRLMQPGLPGGEEITDGAMAVAFQLMAALCGRNWQPLETRLARRRPADPRPYVAQFGAALRFGAEDSSIAFPASWLDHRVCDADPELQRILLGVIEQAPRPAVRDLRDEVRRVVAGNLGTVDVTQASIARAFGLSSSTLHRQLAEQGTTFRDLADEVRFETACRLLSDTAVPVGQVALMLGYSEASAFTRAFTRRFGCGPAAWRARVGASQGARSDG